MIGKTNASSGGKFNGEIVSINLTTNKAEESYNNELVGATVTIKTGVSTLDTFTWEGSQVSRRIQTGVPYTVEVSAVEGYKTPAISEEYIATEGRTTNITFTYVRKEETLKINLDTNQTDNEDIKGVTVTLTIGNETPQIFIWDGSEIQTTIDAGKEYSVSVSDKDGYKTPAVQTRTAVEDAVNTMTFTYKTEIVSISLSTNQTNDTVDLAGKKISLTVGSGQTEELTWQGEVLTRKIPFDSIYTLTVSDELEFYRKPLDVSETADSASRSIALKYETEVVTVTATRADGGSVSGAVITINGTAHTLDSTGICSQKVPFGTLNYTITASAIEGVSPEVQTIAEANQASRNIVMEYVFTTISTIIINQNISDPATMISGDVNGEVIQYIRNNIHRVLAKKTSEGNVTYCRLDDTDSNKYYDGTAATLTDLGCDVFVKLPKFYYKGTEEDENGKVYLYFADGKVDDSYIEWNGNILIGAYEAYSTGNKVYSKSGVDSTGNISQENFKAYARARGTGYQLVDWQMHCVIGCLFYAMYGNTNCQAICGQGTNVFNKVTGADTNSLGMEDTVAGGNGDSGSINFMGLENWWGNKFECVDDFVNPANTLDEYVNDPVNGGTRLLEAPAYSGYPKKMKFGQYLDLIPMESDPKNGSDSQGYCDQQWFANSTNSSTRVVFRSYYHSYAYGGVAYASAGSTSSNTNSYSGSRLAFRGECTEAESVASFKALPVL